MPVTSIDPIQTYYRVAGSLIGRVLLFFAAGWFGGLLSRFTLSFQGFDDLIHLDRVFGRSFGGGGFGIVGEIVGMAFWPVSTAIVSASFSVWLFLPVMLVVAVGFIVFIYSEEPAPAWWIGLVAFIAIVHTIGSDGSTPVSWLVLLVFLIGLGSLFWWSLRVWHPEVVESIGALFRGGQSNHSSYTQIRKKAPPGAWGNAKKSWDEPPPREE